MAKYEPTLELCAVKANARHFAFCVRSSYNPLKLPEEINKNIPEDLWDYFVEYLEEFRVVWLDDMYFVNEEKR